MSITDDRIRFVTLIIQRLNGLKKTYQYEPAEPRALILKEVSPITLFISLFLIHIHIHTQLALAHSVLWQESKQGSKERAHHARLMAESARQGAKLAQDNNVPEEHVAFKDILHFLKQNKM